MRMTNKIMQSNSLYNINQTKILEDKYNTQLTSQSKITRPSDDPVVAIRALRLRSNVTTVSQYYEKNAPDATQWLDVTAQSLNTITDVLTNLYNQVQTGVNKDYTASDMEVILTQIDAYTQEMYATGNQDYAGRYIFTGYRTDTALTMDENELDDEYTITENLKSSQLDSFSYTDYSVFDKTTTSATATESSIKNATINRIRLSYDDLEDQTPGNVMMSGMSEEAKDTLKASLDAITNPAVTASYTQDAETGEWSVEISGIQKYDSAEDAYKDMLTLENGSSVNDDGDAIPALMFVPSTGEVLIRSSAATAINDAIADGASISYTYKKNSWSTDDLNPQHFFECTDSKGITYNAGGDVDTEITYDVGYNQVIQVNTNANEVFDPAITRDYDDLKTLVEQFSEIETIRSEYSDKLADAVEGTDEYDTIKAQYDAADKAYTYIRDAVSTRFGDQISRYQSYLDATDVAITKNGTRSTRLELINARLTDQSSTFKELQEDNEGIDMTEVAVKLTSAETTYDAALLATSKITKESLINYI